MEKRTLLLETATGKIESVANELMTRIEFNCDCLDALTVCNSICCRMRSGYTVELEDYEVSQYESRPHPSKVDVHILKVTPDGTRCVYLDPVKGTCTIHERRPRMCRRWHCSPAGKKDDAEIDVRDSGWVFIPLRKMEADLLARHLEEKWKSSTQSTTST